MVSTLHRKQASQEPAWLHTLRAVTAVLALIGTFIGLALHVRQWVAPPSSPKPHGFAFSVQYTPR